MASINSLPDELLLNIFCYLDVSDIALSVYKVCSRWSVLAHDSVLWNGLSFIVGKNVPIEDVLSLVPHMTQLRTVSLHWRTDTHDIVQAVCSHCPRLVRLRMVCCDSLDSNCVRSLAHTHEGMVELGLGKCWRVPAQCLDDIISLKHLTILNLSHNLLTSRQFRLISINCTKITTLNIDYVRGISEDDLIQFIDPRQDTLQSLTVFGELLTNNIFQHIQLCQNLKLLHISTSRQLTDKCFESIQKLVRLKSLTLRKSVRLSSQALWRFYFHTDTVRKLSYLYISAKRNVNNDDISVWLKTNPDLIGDLVDKYCILILTMSGFKVEMTQE